MALANNLTIAGINYVRVPAVAPNEGRFLDTNTSVNTPHHLIVRPKVVIDGISQFTVLDSLAKDPLVPAPGLKDDLLSVQLSLRGDLRRFTYVEMDAAVQRVFAFWQEPGHSVSILRGEN